MISWHFMTFFPGTLHVCRYLTNRYWMYIMGWFWRWQQALQRRVECWWTERTKTGNFHILFLWLSASFLWRWPTKGYMGVMLAWPTKLYEAVICCLPWAIYVASFQYPCQAVDVEICRLADTAPRDVWPKPKPQSQSLAKFGYLTYQGLTDRVQKRNSENMFASSWRSRSRKHATCWCNVHFVSFSIAQDFRRDGPPQKYFWWTAVLPYCLPVVLALPCRGDSGMQTTWVAGERWWWMVPSAKPFLGSTSSHWLADLIGHRMVHSFHLERGKMWIFP